MKAIDDFSLNIKVSGSILDNSIDLFLDGVESMKHKRSDRSFWSDPPKKSALLAVTTGVELLLKAKIASLDWKKLFQQPNNANKLKLLNGSLFSIKFESILDRIEAISEIRFSQQTKEDIEEIRNTRNKLVHYHCEENENDFVGLIANAIGIYIEFYREYIFRSFYEEIDRTEHVDRELKNEKEYVRQRIKTIRRHVADKSRPLTYHFCECPECLQNVFVLKNREQVICYFCRYEQNIKEIAEDYSEYNNQVKSCPRCDCIALSALHETNDEGEAWQCIVCGFYSNFPKRWGIANNKLSVDSIQEEFRKSPFIPLNN